MLYIDTNILTFESEVILIYLNTYMQILVDDEICCVIEAVFFLMWHTDNLLTNLINMYKLIASYGQMIVKVDTNNM